MEEDRWPLLIKRETVEMLTREKEGTETWDAFLLRLIQTPSERGLKGEKEGSNMRCLDAMKTYIAFVFTILGMFLGLLCTELAKGGDPTLGMGLGVAIFVCMLFGVMAIRGN